MKQLYEDKFGLFVHFGPYAQLAGVWNGEEVTGEWIMNRARIPVKEYEKHAAGLFKPDKFNAKQWVDIAESAGMKFIVVTASGSCWSVSSTTLAFSSAMSNTTTVMRGCRSFSGMVTRRVAPF